MNTTRTYTMDTLPIELLELICGPHRAVVGRIRQVCAAFRQIRGDWPILYRGGNVDMTLDEIINEECRRINLITVDSVICGDHVYAPVSNAALLGHQCSIVSAEYLRMRRDDQPVLIGMVGHLLSRMPYNKKVFHVNLDSPPLNCANTVYFGLIRADSVNDNAKGMFAKWWLSQR